MCSGHLLPSQPKGCAVPFCVIMALPLFPVQPKGALVSCLIYWRIYRAWPRTVSLATPLLLPAQWVGWEEVSVAFLGGAGFPHPTVLASSEMPLPELSTPQLLFPPPKLCQFR